MKLRLSANRLTRPAARAVNQIFIQVLQKDDSCAKLKPVDRLLWRGDGMRIRLTEAQEASLRDFLRDCEDAEQLSAREYVVDLYDLPRPVSLDLVFVRGGVAVDGAAELKYDAEQDGWYMGERLERPEDVVDALARAGALGE